MPPTHPGIVALRDILKRMRWDDQGGYPGYFGNGRWGFVSTSMSQVTPEELNLLFALADITPDTIKTKGYCEDCVFAKACHRDDGLVTYHEQGYSSKECTECQRPKMSNFKARKTFPAGRRFWCLHCGKLFKTRLDRDNHLSLRELTKSRKCS